MEAETNKHQWEERVILAKKQNNNVLEIWEGINNEAQWQEGKKLKKTTKIMQQWALHAQFQ